MTEKAQRRDGLLVPLVVCTAGCLCIAGLALNNISFATSDYRPILHQALYLFGAAALGLIVSSGARKGKGLWTVMWWLEVIVVLHQIRDVLHRLRVW